MRDKTFKKVDIKKLSSLSYEEKLNYNNIFVKQSVVIITVICIGSNVIRKIQKVEKRVTNKLENTQLKQTMKKKQNIAFTIVKSHFYIDSSVVLRSELILTL